MECRDLHRIAGMMILPSDAFAVPGADDPVIFADIIRSLGRDTADVRDAIAALSALAGTAFADLDPERGQILLDTFLGRRDRATRTLGRVLLQCYYRDVRVLSSVGLEARPPFPKGHTLEQGDWSLLNVVRNRPRLWRDDRRA